MNAYPPEHVDPNIARIENNLRGGHFHPPSPNNGAKDQWTSPHHPHYANSPSPQHPHYANSPSPQHPHFANSPSPQHPHFANSPSPQHHIFASNHLNIPTLDQLSERHRNSHKRRERVLQRQHGSAVERVAAAVRRQSDDDASSLSSEPCGYHTDPAVRAEPSWTVQSAESAVSVPPVRHAPRISALPASCHPLGNHASAPSASAVSAEPPTQFFQALRSCYPSPGRGESEMCALSRQLDGAREIKVMARDRAVCASMVEAGAVKLLLLLVDGVRVAGDVVEGVSVSELRLKVAEEAAAALLNLSLDKAAKQMMRRHGVVASVVSLACGTDANRSDGCRSGAHGSGSITGAAFMGLRELAAAIIHSLAQAGGLREDLVDLGGERPLIRLLREPSCSRDAQKDALYALNHISTCESGRVALAEGGAVPLLLEVMLCSIQKGSHLYEKQSERFFDKAMHALANVSKTEQGLNALVSSKVKHGLGENGASDTDGCFPDGRPSCLNFSGLHVLFKLLATGSEATKPLVVATLLCVVRGTCTSNARVLEEIWMLRRKEKPKPHLEALAKAGAPQAQQLLEILYPAKSLKR